MTAAPGAVQASKPRPVLLVALAATVGPASRVPSRMPAGFWTTGGGNPADLSMARTSGRSFWYAAVTAILGTVTVIRCATGSSVAWDGRLAAAAVAGATSIASVDPTSPLGHNWSMPGWPT